MAHRKHRSSGKGKLKKSAQAESMPSMREVDVRQIMEILDRYGVGGSDREILNGLVDSQLLFRQELGKKNISIDRLRRMVFGAPTEKTRNVGKNAKERKPKESKKKPKGHGRNGTDAYTGAETVKTSHATLKAKDPCPCCPNGKLYANVPPERLLVLCGSAPIGGTVYEQEKLRCNLCGEIFKADLPEGVDPDRYDVTCAAILALLKYGMGMPFYRMERLHKTVGIPLATSTQWDIIEKAAGLVLPALDELIYLAAQGRVLHNDDTTMKVLELIDAAKEREAKRTGIFTTGIVSITHDHKIALFFTGHEHAGENLQKVLEQRLQKLGIPIQMCDALSRNVPEALRTILGNCIAHARRRFVDVAENFPDECLYVLELLAKVYKNDATAKKRDMTPEDRLRFHQEHSQASMDELQTWCRQQLDEKKVEPNSGLGEAITYMLKHWKKLTLFLRKAGAPLDNNICERALKKAILNRKNAYFYRTERGASVGDLFMSLIHTCELNEVDPLNYLTELQRHADELKSEPQNWMPWNYRTTLARAGPEPD